MTRKASTHSASAPSKSKTSRSKTANAKSKGNTTPLYGSPQDGFPANHQAHRRCCLTRKEPATQSLARLDRPNPRFTYRDHSTGAKSPAFDIPMITGSKSDEDTTESRKDPTPAQEATSQDTPVGDSESSEAKAASTSSPVQNLTLDESKAQTQAAKATSQKRAEEGAAAAKKGAAPGSPTPEPPIAKGYRSLFDSESEEVEEKGTVAEPQEIFNDLDEEQERYQSAQ
ncbi:Hypothetical protein PHPALM_20876 [Phytophthora palmivora]|uniref:ABC Superfamily n=1 Tax=Phytophthora palmivora TaxID=4796 RepID=A0A2P4XDR3_9STRA|nr:Hypothetical protein PHPALM_20876 [Phytophthora palmivora]